MNFDDSLKYLLDLGNEVLTMKLGLENIRILLAALGNPERKYLKVQVAGTNGKGSTCAFLGSICTSAEIKTGLFTSPHLISITERIKINGEEISEDDFARHATIIRETSEELLENGKLETLPTFFEHITAIAISAFNEERIELAILETGLGGRFDATTAANAEIVAITPIDYDHQEILGNSLTAIASEKAAIIGDGKQVILSRQSPEAEKVISEVCAGYNVTPQSANFEAEIVDSDERGNFTVQFKTNKAEYANARLNLAGRHQIENAKVAILLAETLEQRGFKVTRENIVEGLESAIHKGRLEFDDGILFDGAHNVSGATALKNYLDEFVRRPITMIFGAMKDKDSQEIAEILFPKAAELIFTKADNPRSSEPSELLNLLRTYEIGAVFTTNNVAQAIELARQNTTKDDLILVTGSLYLVGEAQKILKSKNYV